MLNRSDDGRRSTRALLVFKFEEDNLFVSTAQLQGLDRKLESFQVLTWTRAGGENSAGNKKSEETHSEHLV